MTFTFACPSCRQEIQASKGTEGLHGRCPHCAATFTIPQGQETFHRERHQERDRDDYEPRRPRREYDEPGPQAAPGWLAVRNGLLVVRIGAIIAIFAALGLLLTVALASGLIPALEGNRRNAQMILEMLLILLGLVALAAAILTLVGQSMCCAAPESGPKGLAIGSVVCLILTLILTAGNIVASIVQEQQRHPFAPRPNLGPLIAALSILSTIIGTVGHVLFGFFLKGIAGFFQNDRLSKSVAIYLILFGVFVACCLVVLAMLILVSATTHPRDVETARILFLILGVGLLIFALVLVLWFLDLLGRARSTISRAVQEGW
jgi:hypothetical protein